MRTEIAFSCDLKHQQDQQIQEIDCPVIWSTMDRHIVLAFVTSAFKNTKLAVSDVQRAALNLVLVKSAVLALKGQ